MFINVRDFGAAGDGNRLDTLAMQNAIDRCGQAGGGRVMVPAGRYLCGQLRLRNGVELHLTQGAVILASRDRGHYPEEEAVDTAYQIATAVLLAQDIEDAAITGLGAIDGQSDEPLSWEDAQELKFRTKLVICDNCRNLRIQDITLRWSDSWTLHVSRSQDVIIRGLNIRANQGRINTDGIDPDGCRNVIISDCNISTGDDAIVIKSLRGEASENITVTNCVLSSACAALKLGTESVGNIRNITMSNCVVHDTNCCLALYNKDGGTYENILFSNVIFEGQSETPFILDMAPRWYKQPTVGRVRNVSFENVHITGPGRFYVEGHSTRPLENLSIHNLSWDITGPCKTTDVVKPRGSGRSDTDPAIENYLEQPYHFLLMNVKGLRMAGLRAQFVGGTPADRGAYFMHNVTDADVQAPLGFEDKAGLQPLLSRECSNVQVQ